MKIMGCFLEVSRKLETDVSDPLAANSAPALLDPDKKNISYGPSCFYYLFYYVLKLNVEAI